MPGKFTTCADPFPNWQLYICVSGSGWNWPEPVDWLPDWLRDRAQLGQEREIERESLIQIYSCVESNNLVNYSAGDHKPYFRLLLAGLRPKPLMNFDASGLSVYFRVLWLTISWLDWSWCWMCWKCNWFHLKRDAPCSLRVAPPYILVGKQNLPLPKKDKKTERQTGRQTEFVMFPLDFCRRLSTVGGWWQRMSSLTDKFQYDFNFPLNWTEHKRWENYERNFTLK